MRNSTIFKTIIAIVLLLSVVSCGKSNRVVSPNGKLAIEVAQGDDGNFYYLFYANGKQLIDSSLVGYMDVNKNCFPSKQWSIASATESSHSGFWHPLWGKRSKVVDNYNELVLSFSSSDKKPLESMQITLRAYDDGVALKYSLANDAPSVDIAREMTQYNFSDDYRAWFYNGEQHNLGPDRLTAIDGERTPVMTVEVDGDNYMALHEANLVDEDPLLLKSREGETLFEVASSPLAISGGYSSPWRVVFYGEQLGSMVDSHLLELLSPEPEPGMDFSWVTPSVAVWDWRIDGAKVDGFVYSMSYPSWIRMVDFAADNNMKYLLLDANWYGPEFDEGSDPTIGDKAKDVRRLIAYGKEKGVGIWLYLNDVGGRKYPIEETLKQYGQWGAAGVKYGFMSGNKLEKLRRTKMITRLCAENHLCVNYHDDPIHPHGQMRTWPNALSREYCHAQLDAHRVFQPKTFVTTVFVNMLAGPLDMNNGMFDLRQGATDRVDESQPVPSTLASEGARTAIIFSGATVLPDIPEYYYKYPSLLRFIRKQEMPWVESKTLIGEIGKHIVMMRETKNSYLVAGAINEEGGELSVPMNFLPKGKSFSAELTKDGKDAHYLTNREQIEVETLELSSEDNLVVKLACGGGFCLLIEK